MEGLAACCRNLWERYFGSKSRASRATGLAGGVLGLRAGLGALSSGNPDYESHDNCHAKQNGPVRDYPDLYVKCFNLVVHLQNHQRRLGVVMELK